MVALLVVINTMDNKVNFEDKKSLVSSQPCFKVLNDEDVSELTELFVEVSYMAGEVIVTEGEIIDSVFLIVSGVAEVRHVWVDNGVIRADKLANCSGQSIGLSETGFTLSGVRTATVVINRYGATALELNPIYGFVLSHFNVLKRCSNDAQNDG